MSHSLTRIWIHAVWSTKDRFPFLAKNKRAIIINRINEKLVELNCGVRIINGKEDHLHALFLINQNNSIQEIMKNVKGESSHWINQNNLFKAKFSWQIGYGAFSVSESILKKVEKYIKNQQRHHEKITFLEEWNLLLKKHNVIISGNH